MVERVLLDIDTQNDFLKPDGALYVPGAVEILPNLTRLIEYARCKKVPVVSTVDCHAPDDPEFARFPKHCVVDTPGQEKVPQTLLERRITLEPSRRVDRPASLFDQADQIILGKTSFSVQSNINATALFDGIGAAEYVAFGVATDYCVLADVRFLLSRGRSVTVLTDAIRAISEQDGAAALEEMRALGARFRKTDSVVFE